MTRAPFPQPASKPQASGLTLLCDLYQLTMAQGYWHEGMADDEASFTMSFRDNPYGGGYAVACGTDQVADLVEGFGLAPDDVEYLSSLTAPQGGPLFDRQFLGYLSDLRLTVDIDAVPEGSVVFPREPVVRVDGPIMQCQLLETALLNAVNFQTLVATKAARICQVANGPVAAFGLRRAQGPDGGISADRASYVGGCSSVADVLAGKIFGIPVSGTHAHSWVMAFPTELDAFRAYARVFPKNCVLLVDTYDVEQGVRNAIVVGLEMRERGEHLAGIRIDSGDLAWLSRRARAMLDDAGLTDCRIVASNELDEYTIKSLVEQGACIDSYGVGTKLSTAYDQAAPGGVYKLAAIRPAGQEAWSPRIKVSEQSAKTTVPGLQGLRRYYNADGTLAGDMTYSLANPPAPGDEVIVDPLDGTRRKNLSGHDFDELLVPLVRGGVAVGREPIEAARARASRQLGRLDPAVKRFANPHGYPAGLERGLYDMRTALVLASRGIDPHDMSLDHAVLDEVRAMLAGSVRPSDGGPGC